MGAQSIAVMAGRDPAILGLLVATKKGVDHRVKPGDDD
jgi:hypothetical protein